MDKYFSSNENKQIIWQLLLENGYFNNIPENNFQQVQSIFENAINNFANDTSDITNKNKLVIKYVVQNIEVFKKKTIMKPLEEVQISLSKDFENKKEEFINLTKKNIPNNIDFTNEVDKPLQKDEMENMLTNIIKSRDLEINNVTNSSERKVSFTDDDINFIHRLKLESETENNKLENNNLENNNLKNNKLENNKLENNNLENNKLENNKLENNKLEIKELLSKILANQELILSKLDKNN